MVYGAPKELSMEMEFRHIPVLLNECIEGLDIRPDGIYADLTAGGGGHSSAIAAKLSDKGRLIAFDRDPDAVKAASARLAEYSNAMVVHSNYSDRGLSLTTSVSIRSTAYLWIWGYLPTSSTRKAEASLTTRTLLSI